MTCVNRLEPAGQYSSFFAGKKDVATSSEDQEYLRWLCNKQHNKPWSKAFWHEYNFHLQHLITFIKLEKRGDQSFWYELRQSKCHKNFDHFSYSVWMNKNNIVGEYPSFFKPSMWNYLPLAWTSLYWNDLVVAYWRWSLTRIILTRVSSEKRFAHILTLWNIIYCMQFLSYAMCSSMLLLKFFTYSK